MKSIALLPLVALLGGCALHPAPESAVFEICLQRTASWMDDGKSDEGQVAAAVAEACKREAALRGQAAVDTGSSASRVVREGRQPLRATALQARPTPGAGAPPLP